MPVETHQLNCDILVAGGGAAGLPCALAAARCGARVILCQDRPVLGGNASSEVRMHVVGANGTGRFDRGCELMTEAREGGIMEEIRLDSCVLNPQRSASVFDLLLYDKCRTEPNLTLLLNTTLTSVQLRGDAIEFAVAERQSTEDRFQIRADILIDCTGDGRPGVEANAAYMEGRESRAAFGESLAEPEADSRRLGSTILLQARRHDQPMPFVAPEWARSFTRQELRLRLYANPGEEEPTHEYGYWWAEWGGTLDTVKDNEVIRDELLAVALGIWNHVKNGPPEGSAKAHTSTADTSGASHWALDWIGFLPGKRESRRFVGQHVLTEQDVLCSREFPDAIAYGGWSLDLHPPERIDAPDTEPCVQHPVPHLYDIPLRCCVARDISNLMFAGRNLSATHVAFSSTRVMATCAAVGQGVGTAAAYALQHRISPADLASSDVAIAAIQQRLLQDDAFLIGRHNAQADDLARCAALSASTAQSTGAADQVISGCTRAVHGQHGAPPGRCVPGVHRWMSDPAAGLPAWLQLDWAEPVTVCQVQLVFDTGLHRHLTLSHHDGYTSRMIWGQPQPETVRDYTIEVSNGNGFSTVAQVTGNYQRLRRHDFELPEPIRTIRIHITQTNGIDHARIAEVRVYGEPRVFFTRNL
ncbi:MAG: FAD-dependent oxidoreductase [Fuerstiella sp.]